MAKLKEILGEAFNALSEELRNKYKETDLVDSSEYVPKDRFTQVNKEKNDYKNQITDRDKQLEDLKEKAKGNEELTTEIQKLKDANAQTTTDYEAKIKQMEFDTKFDNALSGYNPQNVKAVKALLDMEKVKLDGDTILGLEEQIKALKESDSYLFKNDVGSGTGTIGGAGSGSGADSLVQKLAKQRAETLNTQTKSNYFND